MGLEILLAYIIEPIIYGSSINEWTNIQMIIHWTVICILWAFASLYIISYAKKKYGFDLLEKGHTMTTWQWIVVVAVIIGSLGLSYIDWNGSKIIKEFIGHGPIRFIFQYLYYSLETMLIMLVLVFGQKAFETWFHKPNIPYGGIIVALTWGLLHFLTKNPITGILSVIAGLAFGSVYLLVNRDIKKTYIILWIMFVL